MFYPRHSGDRYINPLTEREAYENSLKYYRDMNDVIETGREEGMQN